MRTQISNAVEAIKLAYLAHSPIVWLVTGDKEVASEIVHNFTIEHFGFFRSPDMGNPVILKEFTDRSSSANEQLIHYAWHGPLDTKNDASVTLMKNLEKFMTVHLNIAADPKLHELDDVKIHAIHRSIAIIASPSLPLESWLNKYIDVIYVDALSDPEISDIICETLNERGISVGDSDKLRQLVVSLRGFSAAQISQIVRRCVISDYFNDENGIAWNAVFHQVRLKKRQLLDGFKGLKWIDLKTDSLKNKPSESLDVISSWLDNRCDIFVDTESAKVKGYDIPKGILITGF